MYITINDIIGEKTSYLSYPTDPGKEIAVVSMLSSNVQYLLKEPVKALLKTGEEKLLSEGVYTDKKLDELIGFEKLGMSHRDYALKWI